MNEYSNKKRAKEWERRLIYLDDVASNEPAAARKAWDRLVQVLNETDNASSWYSAERRDALCELFTRLYRLRQADSPNAQDGTWIIIDQIISRIAKRIGGVRYGLSVEEVEDVRQDVLVRLQDPEILVKCATSNRHPSIELIALVRTAARRIMRANSREIEHLAPIRRLYLAAASDVGSSELLIGLQESDLLRHLTQEEKTLLYWRFVDKKTFSEIAETLDQNYDTVVKRIHRLLERLR